MSDTIHRLYEKGKALCTGREVPFFEALLVLCSALVVGVCSGFLLGRESEKTPVEVSTPTCIRSFQQAEGATAMIPSDTLQTVQNVVVSKKGKKYHFPWCPGVQSIKEENKVWYKTIEDAERAGYTKASNCE